MTLRQRMLPPPRTARRRGQRAGGWRDLGGVIGLGVLVIGVVLGLLIGRIRSARVHEGADASITVQIPSIADVAWNEAWPQLIFRGFPSRPLEQIRAAYAFAARRPDVLRSVPCYCGCIGTHRSNEGCYVRNRSDTGVPRWTDHAFTCPMCIDITRDAIVMTAQNQAVDQIRRTIESRYGGR